MIRSKIRKQNKENIYIQKFLLVNDVNLVKTSKSVRMFLSYFVKTVINCFLLPFSVYKRPSTASYGCEWKGA